MEVTSIPKNIINLINKNPNSPMVDSFARSLFNVIVPKNLSSDEIIKLICEKGVVGKTKTSTGPGTRPPPERTIEVDVRIQETHYGHVSYSQLVTYEGTMDIPFSVFEGGREGVDDYINDNYRDLPEDYGCMEIGDESGVDDYEVNDSEYDTDTAWDEYQTAIEEEDEDDE